MPQYRYTGKAPMRVGSTEVRDGTVIDWEYNPEPSQFVEAHKEVQQAVVVEATPKQAKWRKPLAVTTEEASDGT